MTEVPTQDVFAEPSAPAPAILAAVAAVMKQVTYVPKAGQYSAGRGDSRTEYKFRKFEDTAAALGQAFRDHLVFVQSEVISREIAEPDKKPYNTGSGYTMWSQVFVTMRYRFTSLVDGSTLEAQAIGEGKDSSDKASGKAMTMAMKSALTQAFMIATDDPDPDSERPGDYAEPVGQGMGQQRAQARQQAARERTQELDPQGGNTSSEQRATFASWVAQQLAQPMLDLERLAKIYKTTEDRQLLGIDAGGVALGLRIKACLANFGMDPNGPMPTPEQAREAMSRG